MHAWVVEEGTCSLCSDVSSCREEESLVDMFVIEMLVVMIHSLKMAHRDEKALGEFTYY